MKVLMIRAPSDIAGAVGAGGAGIAGTGVTAINPPRMTRGILALRVRVDKELSHSKPCIGNVEGDLKTDPRFGSG
jgi:hypothetical protein